MIKTTYISCGEEDNQALYIDGKYVTGHYYLMLDGAIDIVKHLAPEAEIKTYEMPEETMEDLNGFPVELPNNFVELWNLVDTHLFED